MVGRIFAYKFKAFLSFNSPCSGRFLGFDHLGPPIAPSKMASEDLHASNVSSVRGVP